jgi:uncharacterized protein (TIGR02996 family)
MPRQPWRDDPEYVSLWRAARMEPDVAAHHLVMADWLEERGHQEPAWRERIHGLAGHQPEDEFDHGVIRAWAIPLGMGSWQRLLAAPPPDDVAVVFKRDTRAYQYLCRFKGRCGLDLEKYDWSSPTELRRLLSIPRLEAIACNLVGQDGWRWLMSSFPGLTWLDADGPLIDPSELAALPRLAALRSLALRGRAAQDTSEMRGLPALRHLWLRGFWYEADTIADIVPPEVESLHADIASLGKAVRWPNLRSFRHLGSSRAPSLTTEEAKGLAASPLLECVEIRCHGMKGPAIKALSEMPRLRELGLSFGESAVPYLKALARAPSLESLSVSGEMNERHLVDIASIQRLRSLSIIGVPAAASLAGLTALTRLESLHLSGEGAAPPIALAELPLLEKLNLQSYTMPPASARAIKAACPPWVECLVSE